MRIAQNPGRAARAFAGLAVCLLLDTAADPARGWVSPVPDVVLYCTPAMAAPLRQAAARYRAGAQVEVHIFVAPPDGLIGLLKHRARADVVVADAVTLQTMAETGLVRPPSVTALGRDPFVLVARAGAGLPQGATAAQLVATHGTVLPDPTTAASFAGAAVLRQAVPPLAPPTPIGVSDTPTVIEAVRQDSSLIGLVNATEAAPGLDTVARVAVPPVPVGGALVSLGQSGKAADLLAFIAGPDGRGILRRAGLEPQ